MLNFSQSIYAMTEGQVSACSYTAVGVFVLGRLFREAWGKEAPRMQEEFNVFLEVYAMPRTTFLGTPYIEFCIMHVSVLVVYHICSY